MTRGNSRLTSFRIWVELAQAGWQRRARSRGRGPIVPTNVNMRLSRAQWLLLWAVHCHVSSRCYCWCQAFVGSDLNCEESCVFLVDRLFYETHCPANIKTKINSSFCVCREFVCLGQWSPAFFRRRVRRRKMLAASSSSTCRQMRCIRRHSITESFQLEDNFPVPGLCRGGARIKVCTSPAVSLFDDQWSCGQKDDPMERETDDSRKVRFAQTRRTIRAGWFA